jgi:hypothetical protein
MADVSATPGLLHKVRIWRDVRHVCRRARADWRSRRNDLVARIKRVPNIPWIDDAVLVRTPNVGGDRSILFEGRLLDVVDYMADLPRGSWPGLSIHLPNRGARPFSYQGDDFADLLFARKRL